MYGLKTYTLKEAKKIIDIELLQQQVLRFSFINLLLVSFVGVFLRVYPFFDSFPLVYKNILHGHSHFAFGGWAMPVLFALVMKVFPDLTNKVAYHHWRNIAVLMFISAIGMLLSFPVQGYKAVSITFSTLSLISGFYWMVVTLKALKQQESSTSHKFIKWGFYYFALSSIGPFATGPLIAMGYQGSNLYYDAIYFYLHFQYNGFFTFLVMALLYKALEKHTKLPKGKKAFTLLNIAVIPTFALSVLWHPHSFIFNIIGGAAAAVQVVALFYFLKDIHKGREKGGSILFDFAIIAFALKIFIQLASAFPFVAALGYEHRNFVIAYLHLVLLGFISFYAFSVVFENIKGRDYKIGMTLFIISFLLTEIFLVVLAFAEVFVVNLHIQKELLLLAAVFFPAGIGFLLNSLKHSKPLLSSL